MLFHQAFDILHQLSESKVGATPSGNYLRYVPIDQSNGGLNDAILTTLESARRIFSKDHGSVEFMFYQPSDNETFIVLRGRSLESVAQYDFQEQVQRISEMLNELLGDWVVYDLSAGDILFPVQDKVLEIPLADLSPIVDVAMIKAFTFGQPIGAAERASIVGNFVLDLLRHTNAPESLLPIK